MVEGIISLLVYLLPLLIDYFKKDHYDVQQDFRTDVVKGNADNVQRDIVKLLTQLRNRS